MADTALPAAGWYADGSSVGVRRWFDGSGWTEDTMPDLDYLPQPSVAPDSRFAPGAFGDAVPSRLNLTTSQDDLDARDAAFLRHRIADACRTRRSAVGEFVSALVLLLVTGGISLALGSPDELWLVGGLGAGYLLWRAVRDYDRAVHRGAPRFPLVAWIPAVVGLVAALAVFVAAPVEAAHHVSHALDGLDGLAGLGG